MSVCFDGIGEMVATFHVAEGGEVLVGDAVTLTDGATVGMGASGNVLCGIVTCVDEDGCAAVQVGGFAQAGYTGTAPTVGMNALCVDGKGGILVKSGGMNCLVVSVDTHDKTCIVKL